MSSLEIISRLCDVTNTLSEIVKKQQTIIEQAKIEEEVRAELQKKLSRQKENLMSSNTKRGDSATRTTSRRRSERSKR